MNQKIIQKSKIELNENQNIEFIFGDEKIVVVIKQDEEVKKDFEYIQDGREAVLIFYNITEKRAGNFIPTITLEGKSITFNYAIEKIEERYVLEYYWDILGSERVSKKKSFFERLLGTPKHLSAYMASFMIIFLFINVTVLTFLDKSNYDNFWPLVTHTITCCLGYLFGHRISESEQENLESKKENLSN